MPNPKLTAILTALMLSATAMPGFGDYSLEELQLLEQLVVTKDTVGLGRLLATNPQFVRGDDPLARELRGFQTCYQAGGLECFASARVVRVTRSQAESKPANIY